MLHVACVRWGNKYGPEYVERLRRGVTRHMPSVPWCFDVFDESRLPAGVAGWWNKLALFAADAFPHGDRVVYFDLDTLIRGPLDLLVRRTEEIMLLRDPFNPKQNYSSACMLWTAGCADFWDRWNEQNRPTDGFKIRKSKGDQAFIQWCIENPRSKEARRLRPARLQDVLPGMFRSYKVDCAAGPRDAAVVLFHGKPAMHEVVDAWVTEEWSA